MHCFVASTCLFEEVQAGTLLVEVVVLRQAEHTVLDNLRML